MSAGTAVNAQRQLQSTLRSDAPGAAPRVVTNAHMPELWNAGGPTSID